MRNLEISKDRPWMLQQFLQGAEFSCYTIAHHGKVVAHVDNKAELSCLNYDHIGLPEVCQSCTYLRACSIVAS